MVEYVRLHEVGKSRVCFLLFCFGFGKGILPGCWLREDTRSVLSHCWLFFYVALNFVCLENKQTYER